MPWGASGNAHNEVCVIMQKLQLIFGISAILSAIATLYLWPKIRSKFLMATVSLLVASIAYVIIWFILCYAVAVGMYLVGWG